MAKQPYYGDSGAHIPGAAKGDQYDLRGVSREQMRQRIADDMRSLDFENLNLGDTQNVAEAAKRLKRWEDALAKTKMWDFREELAAMEAAGDHPILKGWAHQFYRSVPAKPILAPDNSAQEIADDYREMVEACKALTTEVVRRMRNRYEAMPLEVGGFDEQEGVHYGPEAHQVREYLYDLYMVSREVAGLVALDNHGADPRRLLRYYAHRNTLYGRSFSSMGKERTLRGLQMRAKRDYNNAMDAAWLIPDSAAKEDDREAFRRHAGTVLSHLRNARLIPFHQWYDLSANINQFAWGGERQMAETNDSKIPFHWEAYKEKVGLVKRGSRESDEPRRGAPLKSFTAEEQSRHRDRLVTPEELVSEFGLKGVQWGNYVSQKQRREWASLAWDALADLAEVTGLEHKNIGLGGRLGLAIGARGKGKAAAHYEPDHKVINLTKSRGAGTIAHEWGHALDHWLKEAFTGSGASLPGVDGGEYLSRWFASYNRYLPPSPDSLNQAIRDLPRKVSIPLCRDGLIAISEVRKKPATPAEAFRHKLRDVRSNLNNMRDDFRDVVKEFAMPHYATYDKDAGMYLRPETPSTADEWKEWARTAGQAVQRVAEADGMSGYLQRSEHHFVLACREIEQAISDVDRIMDSRHEADDIARDWVFDKTSVLEAGEDVSDLMAEIKEKRISLAKAITQSEAAMLAYLHVNGLNVSSDVNQIKKSVNKHLTYRLHAPLHNTGLVYMNWLRGAVGRMEASVNVLALEATLEQEQQSIKQAAIVACKDGKLSLDDEGTASEIRENYLARLKERKSQAASRFANLGGLEKYPGEHTEWFQQSLTLDGGKQDKYWSSPWELFARSVEVGVHDTLDREGRSNGFLVCHTENAAYPQGEERLEISERFTNWLRQGVAPMANERLKDYEPPTPGEVKELSKREARRVAGNEPGAD